MATVKINLGCRISEAEAVYAAPGTTLTPDEQTRIFLLDHGLINANELEALLMRCNLSQRTAKFLSNSCVCNAISEERLAGSAATLPAEEAAPALGSSQAVPSADTGKEIEALRRQIEVLHALVERSLASGPREARSAGRDDPARRSGGDWPPAELDA